MTQPAGLEARIEAALHGEGGDALALLAELYDRYRTQDHLLERLTHISDRFQQAERERNQSYAEYYDRKVRQIEKIVHISDQYQAMLRDLNERLKRISTHDELTGLPNRRHLRERIAQAAAQGKRTGAPCCIALADIDRFKKVNDTLGHSAGDAVLVRTAQALHSGMRQYDLCGRWGGEEFLMLFPGCVGADAVALAERIRGLVAAIGEAPHVTLSVGVTELRPGEALDEALKRADAALYKAKEFGRDRVVLHQPAFSYAS